MTKLLLIFVGGGIGSVLRYSMGLLVNRISNQNQSASDESTHWLMMFPASTLLVNIIGCGLIGFAWGMLGDPKDNQSLLQATLIIGVLGGFTTFSSFGWETIEMINDARPLAAGSYVLASVTIGLLAAWAGHAIGLNISGVNPTQINSGV